QWRHHGVAGCGDVDAMRAGTVRDEGERFLLVALPIAAMNEHKKRRLLFPAREIVEAGTRSRPIDDVEPGAGRCPNDGASFAPTRQPLRTVSHRSAVVIRGIKGRPIHPAIDRGACGASLIEILHVSLPPRRAPVAALSA